MPFTGPYLSFLQNHTIAVPNALSRDCTFSLALYKAPRLKITTRTPALERWLVTTSSRRCLFALLHIIMLCYHVPLLGGIKSPRRILPVCCWLLRPTSPVVVADNANLSSVGRSLPHNNPAEPAKGGLIMARKIIPIIIVGVLVQQNNCSRDT